MHNFMDAKLMAKLLRQGLADRQIDLSHSECLELVARQFGVANWNILSARIEAEDKEPAPLPAGWFLSGKSPAFYHAGLDPDRPGTVLIMHRDELAGQIRGDDFCTVMQSADATSFRGKRLRLSGDLRTDEVSTGATLWFRVDGPKGTIQFDNLEFRTQDGPLKGNCDWTERSVVFDIPAEATSLHYGFYLKGLGKVWSRRFALDTVDAATPVSANRGGILPGPTNLDFRQPPTN
ncbi:hypothetical protein FPZ08_04365 [Devosia ginsengisoli]|uniref:Glyoxalase-related protein domain-containing protein n=2 Tax=Devosia ginsengisoli TaxID=400770 RepID=A0A5B8LQT6_9HYPH|nr:hypothetical protein FPZ08_04365 [Devosia ginsengisoli]